VQSDGTRLQVSIVGASDITADAIAEMMAYAKNM
jgi:hypothetical protein